MITPKISQECTIILQLDVHVQILCCTKTSWTPTLAEVSYKFGFAYFSIHLQYKISGSSVSFLLFLEFGQNCYSFRYGFFLQYERANALLAFRKNNMFRKNLVLELNNKILKTNQNGGFLKVQYLANNLRYEVEFLDVTRGP